MTILIQPAHTREKPSRPLNAAVIGLGRHVVEEHLPALRASDNYNLVALCDSNPDVLERMKAEQPDDVKYFSVASALFSACDIDLAIVALPHDKYLPIIAECASHGVHVLKEKPFARDLGEATRLLDITENSNIHLMTTFQRRFHPLYQAFLPMLDLLGGIRTISCLYTLPSKNPNSGWRGRFDQAGGGVLLDMGYHILDLLIWYMDKPNILSCTTQISKRNGYDVEDTAQFTFEVNGAQGSALISCVYPKKHEELVFVGEKGSAVLTRNRIERYNNNQVLVDFLESGTGWLSAMINQLDYLAMVIAGHVEEKYSTPQFQIQNHVAVMDELYKQAKGVTNE